MWPTRLYLFGQVIHKTPHFIPLNSSVTVSDQVTDDNSTFSILNLSSFKWILTHFFNSFVYFSCNLFLKIFIVFSRSLVKEKLIHHVLPFPMVQTRPIFPSQSPFQLPQFVM